MLEETLSKSNLVIFDGECIFCNAAVNFIIKRDPKTKFIFTPMQSELAKQLMKKYQVEDLSMDTLLLIKQNQCLNRSTAALEIARELSGFWYLSLIFKIIPCSIRDIFYKILARNRYVLFGRRSECIVPSAKVRSRFISL